uniref:Cytochrome c oxidase subunit 3 n=1 Tax=Dactylogyrus lamellatus TaxID=231327 RepID=A0A342K3V1_9PLAT|nr:cytochrome c oxidase subunit III [Dactylogyrus lamellatus]ALP29095.1 cytochrome c oxidase subunit III [Dactylogyrus lamellatus]
MTWLPFFNAFAAFIFLVSAILWNLTGVQLVFGLGLVLALFLWLETNKAPNLHFLDSFWMFILSEVLIFGSLLTSCLWFQEEGQENLSPYLEIPFFGCFLLIGSSITITAYHHTQGSFVAADLHLLVTLVLGINFVLLQLEEFSECSITILDSVYHASCFCTVGLHFSHVVIGLLLLITLFIFGEEVFGSYYSTLFIWYWHFVDYIWLIVYTVVYLCS